MIKVDIVTGEVTVDKKTYDNWMEQLEWLACLEEAGVDNWEGISYAYGLCMEKKEESNG